MHVTGGVNYLCIFIWTKFEKGGVSIVRGSSYDRALGTLSQLCLECNTIGERRKCFLAVNLKSFVKFQQKLDHPLYFFMSLRRFQMKKDQSKVFSTQEYYCTH